MIFSPLICGEGMNGMQINFDDNEEFFSNFILVIADINIRYSSAHWLLDFFF